MPSDQFERKLRQRLEGAELPPSPDLWAAIAEQVGPPPRKRRAGFWWWLDGSALVLLAALWLWPVAPAPEVAPQLAAGTVSINSSETAHQPIEDRGQTASLSERSADRSLSTDSRIDSYGRGLESHATSNQLIHESTIPPSPNSRISDQVRGLESHATSNQPIHESTSSPATDSRIDSHERGLESHATSNQDRGQTASLSERSADRSLSTDSRISDHGRGLESHATSNQLINQFTNSPTHQFTISALGPRQELILTNWNHPTVFPQENLELAAPSPWRFRLGMMAGISPTANGWVWNSQIHEPDIRANYSRSLGANQVAEEEIHLFRLPNRKIGVQAAVEYQLSRHWSLETGLSWLRSSQGTYEKGSISGEQPIGPTVRDPFIEVENQYQFRLSQVEIPLQLHAHVYPNGQHWSVSAGLLLGHSRSWQVQDVEGTNVATEDRSLRNANQANVLSLRPWYGQAVGQIQYYAPLPTGGEWYVGPIARYQLSGQYGGLQAAGQSRYLLGLQAGLRLRP